MLKCRPPMINDEVCRAATDKHTNTHANKHAFRVKTEETFLKFKFSILYFCFSDPFQSKTGGFQKIIL